MMGVVGVRTACWEMLGVAFAACASFRPRLSQTRRKTSAIPARWGGGGRTSAFLPGTRRAWWQRPENTAGDACASFPAAPPTEAFGVLQATDPGALKTVTVGREWR